MSLSFFRCTVRVSTSAPLMPKLSARAHNMACKSLRSTSTICELKAKPCTAKRSISISTGKLRRNGGAFGSLGSSGSVDGSKILSLKATVRLLLSKVCTLKSFCCICMRSYSSTKSSALMVTTSLISTSVLPRRKPSHTEPPSIEVSMMIDCGIKFCAISKAFWAPGSVKMK